MKAVKTHQIQDQGSCFTCSSTNFLEMRGGLICSSGKVPPHSKNLVWNHVLYYKLPEKYFRTRITHENYFHEYNYTMYISKRTVVLLIHNNTRDIKNFHSIQSSWKLFTWKFLSRKFIIYDKRRIMVVCIMAMMIHGLLMLTHVWRHCKLPGAC